jgi:hypothetical protein
MNYVRFYIFTAVTMRSAVFCSHLLTVVPRSRIFLPWRCRRYVPPKRRFERSTRRHIPEDDILRYTAFCVRAILVKCKLTYKGEARCFQLRTWLLSRWNRNLGRRESGVAYARMHFTAATQLLQHRNPWKRRNKNKTCKAVTVPNQGQKIKILDGEV